VPWSLKRFHASGQAHFVTFCCCHRYRSFGLSADVRRRATRPLNGQLCTPLSELHRVSRSASFCSSGVIWLHRTFRSCSMRVLPGSFCSDRPNHRYAVGKSRVAQ